MVNGKLEGEYNDYYMNGQLHIQSMYRNGKLEGEYNDYYKNGRLHNQCTEMEKENSKENTINGMIMVNFMFINFTSYRRI